MTPLRKKNNSRGLARLSACIGIALAAPGCATMWDDVTSRDFHVKSIWERSDPMMVLQESSDGDARAKAIRAVKEPRANGGNDVEQDRLIEILAQSAISDPQPVVRLAAIQTLGRFTDPRSVQILTGAYEAAAQLPSEVSAGVQSAALAALGTTRQQAAIGVLVKAATKPLPTDVIEKEVNQARDVRLSAVRALKNFEGSPEAAAAMTRIVSDEKDVAIIDRARETHAKLTGREIPAESTNSPAAPTPVPTTSAGGDIKLTGGGR